MNRNFKRAECSAKSFFYACMLLKLKKINFITVKDQLKQLINALAQGFKVHRERLEGIIADLSIS